MRPLFLFRLFLDFLAVSCLLFAMAYFAFNNATHEIVGTVMFLLLIAHNIFNRRWYGTIVKRRREPRSLIVKIVNISLLTAMLTLLATSIAISQTIFSFLPLNSTFIMRQVHTLAANGAIVIAGLHLGLHWTMLMGLVQSKFNIATETKSFTYALRGLAFVVATGGIYSFFEQDVGSKLLMQQNFEFGDLQTPVLTLLLQYISIVGFFSCLAHYTSKMLHVLTIGGKLHH
jgi:Domain of unknown function (DUF4405)